MRTCLAVAFLIAVSGCVPATVTGSDGDTITVHYNPLVSGEASRQQVAQEECARGGRTAKLVEIERETLLIEHAARYDCLPKIEPYE